MSIVRDDSAEPVIFAQDGAALHVNLPAQAPGRYAHVLKIAGLKTNPSTNTRDGNPR